MGKRVLIYLLLILLAYTAYLLTSPKIQAKPKKSIIFNEKVLWSLIQEWKKPNSYIEDQMLCEIANIRVEQIKKRFSHEDFYTLIKNNPKYPYTFTENILFSFNAIEQRAFDGWLNSASHRATLDERYTYSCLRCSKKNEINYCVQIFSNL